MFYRSILNGSPKTYPLFGAVTYAIKQYNRTLGLSRRILLKKADPDKYDLNLNILQQAQINDDDYYAHVLSHDLMSIIENGVSPKVGWCYNPQFGHPVFMRFVNR